MKVKFLIIMFFCAFFLSAQLIDSCFLDNEIYDVEICEDLIAFGDDFGFGGGGVSWRYCGGNWQSDNQIRTFRTEWNSIVLGKDGNFAVSLYVIKYSDLQQDSVNIAFFEKDFGTVNTNISITEAELPLLGYDGFFDEKNDKYYFPMRDSGVAVLGGGKLEIIESGFCVNSISKDYGDYDFIALSDSGYIYKYDGSFDLIGALALNPEEEAQKIVKDFSDTSVLIMVTDTLFNKKLYRWNEKKDTVIYSGSIMRAVTVKKPDKFIYILDDNGKFFVLNEGGSPNESRRQYIANKSNVDLDYIKLWDISVFENSLAFASNKGIFYSKNEESNFQRFLKYEKPRERERKSMREVMRNIALIVSFPFLFPFLKIHYNRH